MLVLTEHAQSSTATATSSAPAQATTQYDCLVLSGGGAKGAYGAGAAKAVDAYRRHRGIGSPLCYIGTSAGALNAYILAAEGPDALVNFWCTVTNEAVLGVRKSYSRTRTLLRLMLGWISHGTPFSFYSNSALDKLIRTHASLGAISANAPLILAVTDYTEGRPKAFYVSPLVERLAEIDAKEPVRKRRLAHLRKIESDDMLARALLASAAIPVFFPPVFIETTHEGKVEKRWYIDGGVGNNTPTREAAYLFRYLSAHGMGNPGVVYCVKQDAPRIFAEDSHLGLADILKRTADVYHYIHTTAVVDAWSRISREVRDQQDKIRRTFAWVDQLSVTADVREQIKRQVQHEFSKMGGRIARLDMPMVEIEPTTPKGLGDTLDFDPKRARQNIIHGYNDMLHALRNPLLSDNPGRHTPLDEAEYKYLLNMPVLPE